jgi:predicted enzyme related to lactoylglutathione lyase
MIYTIIKLNGKDVGGLYQMPSNMLEQGFPPHWLNYVSVTNADEATAQAKSSGGAVMNGPLDVMDAGRMSVIQDPTGAVFAIWQPKEYQGSSISHDLGTYCWQELGTSDPQKAKDFYATLFGWAAESFPGPMEYTMLKKGQENVGGMYEITPDMGPIPPHWLTYFAVADCDATVQQATQNGGSVMKPAEDIPGVGRFAILRDPASAVFAILKPATPEA